MCTLQANSNLWITLCTQQLNSKLFVPLYTQQVNRSFGFFCLHCIPCAVQRTSVLSFIFGGKMLEYIKKRGLKYQMENGVISEKGVKIK
jgi:hypothetical protein